MEHTICKLDSACMPILCQNFIYPRVESNVRPQILQVLPETSQNPDEVIRA